MALDFSQVTSVTIPEGSVTKIQINGVTVWELTPTATRTYNIYDKLLINPTNGTSHYRIPLTGIQLTTDYSEETAPVIELDFSFPNPLTPAAHFWGTNGGGNTSTNYRVRLFNNSASLLSCDISSTNTWNSSWSSEYADVPLAGYFYNSAQTRVYAALRNKSTGTSIKGTSTAISNSTYRSTIRSTDFVIGNFSSSYTTNYANDLSVYGASVWTGTWTSKTVSKNLVPATREEFGVQFVGLVDLLSGQFYPVYDSSGAMVYYTGDQSPMDQEFIDVIGSSTWQYDIQLPDVPLP